MHRRQEIDELEEENDQSRKKVSAQWQAIIIFSVYHRLPVSDEDDHFVTHWLQLKKVFNETCCCHRNTRVEGETADGAGAFTFCLQNNSLIELFNLLDINPQI